MSPLGSGGIKGRGAAEVLPGAFPVPAEKSSPCSSLTGMQISFISPVDTSTYMYCFSVSISPLG